MQFPVNTGPVHMSGAFMRPYTRIDSEVFSWCLRKIGLSEETVIVNILLCGI